MTERRERTELLTTDCAHCRKHQSIEEQATKEQVALRARLLAHPRWFAALFPGTCAQCGHGFPAGTAIRSRMPVPSGAWVAECCAEEQS